MYSNLAGILLNSVPVLPSSAKLAELGRVLRIPAGLLQELGGDWKVLRLYCKTMQPVHHSKESSIESSFCNRNLYSGLTKILQRLHCKTMQPVHHGKEASSCVPPTPISINSLHQPASKCTKWFCLNSFFICITLPAVQIHQYSMTPTLSAICPSYTHFHLFPASTCLGIREMSSNERSLHSHCFSERTPSDWG